MSFQTEKETEYWMSPMWANMPLSDGKEQLVENTRQFWAMFWHLRDKRGFSNSQLIARAKKISHDKHLPYEIGFVINVYSLTNNT